MNKQVILIPLCIIACMVISPAFADDTSNALLDAIIQTANAADAERIVVPDTKNEAEVKSAKEEVKEETKEERKENKGFLGIFGSNKKNEVVEDEDKNIKVGKVPIVHTQKERSSFDLDIRKVTAKWNLRNDYNEDGKSFEFELLMPGFTYQSYGEKTDFKFGLWVGTGLSDENFNHVWHDHVKGSVKIAGLCEISATRWLKRWADSPFSVGIDYGINVDSWNTEYEYGSWSWMRENDFITQITGDIYIGLKGKWVITELFTLSAYYHYSPFVYGKWDFDESRYDEESDVFGSKASQLGFECAYNLSESGALVLNYQTSSLEFKFKDPEDDDLSVDFDKTILTLGYRFKF